MVVGDDRVLKYVRELGDCDADWMLAQIPRLDCPDEEFERTYYFRWSAFRKHIKETPRGRVITEFLPDVPWAGPHNTISCAAGHHIREGRWLRDPAPVLEYINFWYRGGGDLHAYSNWVPDALRGFCEATGDYGLAVELLPELVASQEKWEAEHAHESGLFWSDDDRDGGEFSISGPGLRTTLNCYLYGSMRAIAELAGHAGRKDLRELYSCKAERLAGLIRARLWDEESGFFRCIPLKNRLDPVESWAFEKMDRRFVARELWGYLPWYFGVAGEGRDAAWRELFDKNGFWGEYGPATAERRHPMSGLFYTGAELREWLESHGETVGWVGEKGHECLWNGPSWPFATSQALTALANYIHTSASPAVTAREYFQLLSRYARSHRRVSEDGTAVPWIDENLHPDTGDWISRSRLSVWTDGSWDGRKGGAERGKDYNHSTFCDLVIGGLFGVRPDLDDFRPLLAGTDWDHACLDGVPCRGRLLTVIYDRDGSRYGLGAGVRVLADGKEIYAG